MNTFMKGIFTTILFAVIPMLLEACLICRRKIGKRDKAIRCVLTLIIVHFVGIIFLFSYKNLWTVYEYILLYTIALIIVTLLILPLIYKESIDIDKILFIFCLIVISVAVYSILTYGQTDIHSDVATATNLAQCQVRSRNIFPYTWCYGNGEIWVLGLNIFVMPFSVFMQNQSLARMLGSVLITIVALTAMYYQSRKIFRNHSWLLSIPLLLVFLSGSLDAVLYQAAYMGQVLWIALTCTMADMMIHDRQKKNSAFCLAILLILLCMGSIRQIAENTLPLWGACMIFLYARNKNEEKLENYKEDFKRAVFLSLWILLPSFIGFGIYKILCISRSVIDTGENELQFVMSLSECWNNIIAVFIHFFGDFGFAGGVKLISIDGIRNLILIIFCTLIVFIVPVLQYRKIKEENDHVVFFYIFGLLHNLIMLVVAIFCGKTEGRYLLTCIFVNIIIASQYVTKHWLRKGDLQKNVVAACFIAASFIQCIALLKQSAGWQEIVAGRKAFSQELTKHDLRKGYASYWYAYANEVYSDMELRIGGIHINENGIVPYYWLVDSDVFHAEDENTFLLLTQEEKNVIDGNIQTLFGNPIEEFSVGEMYVYVFDYDIIKNVG